MTYSLIIAVTVHDYLLSPLFSVFLKPLINLYENLCVLTILSGMYKIRQK